MSIPVHIRRRFKLDTVRQARIVVDGDAIVIRPVKELDALLGSFKTDIRVTPQEERSAFERALSEGKV